MKIFLESQDNPNILIKDLVLKINSKLYRKPTQESSELEEESQKEEKNEALDKLKENHLIRESFRSISDTFLFIGLVILFFYMHDKFIPRGIYKMKTPHNTVFETLY